MSLNPETLYNIVLDIGGLKSGCQYTSIYQSAGDQKQVFRFAEVVNVDVSDVYYPANQSFNSAKKKKICEWSNGSKLFAYFWGEPVTDINPPYNAHVKLVGTLRLENGSNIITPNGADFGTHVVSSGIIISDLPYARTYGVRFALMTQYPGDQAVVENLTKADRILIMCFCPIYAESLPGTMQSWDSVVSNKTMFYEVVNGYPNDRDTDMLAYPSLTLYHWNGCFTYDDIDDLWRQLNGQAPINKDDVYKPVTPGDNPPQDDDPSGPGGGGGNYDRDSDPIDFPPLPTGGALGSGSIKGFLVSTGTLTSLFQTLWNASIFDIATQFQKLVDNPMDCIISLHCLPVVPSVGSSSNIILGSFDTGIASPVISNQYLTIDCGSLDVKEFWGSALDYNPYTKTEIYLPFVGIKQLDTDDVMKSTVHIKYNIDVLTGDCLANIKCGKSVLYKFSGNLKQDIPVSGRTNNQAFKLMQALVGEAGAFTLGNAIGGPGLGVVTGILSGASTVSGSKVTTTRGGALSGSIGLMDDFRPFFIFHRPVQSLARNFNTFKGYPSNITSVLSSLTGYTEVEYINLQNIPNATSAEMEEIKNLLKNGVLL